MASTATSTDPHEIFTEWALANGVIDSSVKPHRFEGRGLGMVATKNIKKGDTVVEVPTSLILNTDKIPPSFKAEFPEGTVNHALIAAWLTHGGSETLKDCSLWYNTWPTRKDFEDTMPLLWPVAVGGVQWPGNEPVKPNDVQHNIIPPGISGHWNTFQIERSTRNEQEHRNIMVLQERRLRKAFEDVSSARPDTDWHTFSYFWLILNTRSFYWVGPDQEPPEDRNEALALVPFADYFNHADVECDVSFTDTEYTLKATQDYSQGQEVYMNYGSHSNDLLLAEYGFIMDSNEDDCIYLDDIILRDLDIEKQEELQLNQYYGKYVVTREGVCYRTEVAAGLMYMELEDWRNHVLEGSTDGVDENKSQAIIKGWLSDYLAETEVALETIKVGLQSNLDFMANRDKVITLQRRWEQIKATCEGAMEEVGQ